MVTILTEDELRGLVALDLEAVEAVAEGFRALAEGRATIPPVVRVDVPEQEGEVDIKTAYIRSLPRFAVKVASGFFRNRERGLPSGNGLMVVLSAETGFPEAVLLDNGYLTDLRTAAAGALAARHLAPRDVETAGVIGAGAQARYQIRALKLVRDFRRLLVYSRMEESAAAYSQEMAEGLGVEAEVRGSAEEAVRESGLVVTTTPAQDPYLKAEWLHPGLHITAIADSLRDLTGVGVQDTAIALLAYRRAEEAGRGLQL